MSTELGSAVRARRKVQGLTIEALAFKAGVSVATVNRVETGKYTLNVSTLTSIAEALDTTAADLLTASVAS